MYKSFINWGHWVLDMSFKFRHELNVFSGKNQGKIWPNFHDYMQSLGKTTNLDQKSLTILLYQCLSLPDKIQSYLCILKLHRYKINM